MTKDRDLALYGVLFVLGAGWGLTFPLAKIAVTGGLLPFGMIFWQFTIGAVILALVLRGQVMRLRFGRAQWGIWLMIAFLGTIIPNWASYAAIPHLPAGVMSMVISLVPLLAFPIALMLGAEPFVARRLLGLALGFVAMAMIALPEAALPDRAAIPFLLIAVIGPFCYAWEGNLVARWGTAGMRPIEVLFGASVLGAVLIWPVAQRSGQMFTLDLTRLPVLAMMLSSAIHIAAYTGYVWLVGRAGPVFAGQTGYLVTGLGVVWSMLLLGERYPLWIWGALVVLMIGVTLVQPRTRVESLAEAGDTAS